MAGLFQARASGPCAFGPGRAHHPFRIHDYRLLSGIPHSPLKNKGVNVGVTEDILGAPRPFQGAFDLGAYESQERDLPFTIIQFK